MTNCKECVHNTVCGEKVNYKKYVEEMNELHKKYDFFEKNPACPEFMNKEKVNLGLELLLQDEHDEDETDELDKLLQELCDEEYEADEDSDLDELDKLLQVLCDEEDNVDMTLLDKIFQCSIDFITTETEWEKQLFGDISIQDRIKMKCSIVEDMLLELLEKLK